MKTDNKLKKKKKKEATAVGNVIHVLYGHSSICAMTKVTK